MMTLLKVFLAAVAVPTIVSVGIIYFVGVRYGWIPRSPDRD